MTKEEFMVALRNENVKSLQAGENNRYTNNMLLMIAGLLDETHERIHEQCPDCDGTGVTEKLSGTCIVCSRCNGKGDI